TTHSSRRRSLLHTRTADLAAGFGLPSQAGRLCHHQKATESSNSSPSATPRHSKRGTKTCATGASAARSGGDIGYRCGRKYSPTLRHRMLALILKKFDAGVLVTH